MVEIGRAVPRDPPDPVGRAPAEFRGGRGMAGKQAQGGARRLLVGPHHVEPREDQRADAVADLHRGDALCREGSGQPRIDARIPGLDHAHRAVGESESGMAGIDSERVRRRFQRRVAPAVEHGLRGDRGAERGAHFVERGIGGERQGRGHRVGHGAF